MLAALISAALLLASAGQAAEDPVPKQAATSAANLEEARQHAAKAKVHYDLGEFDKAAEEYILVYRLRPLPALLFNIAQSYRQAGQYEKAKQFYKAYLRESPDAKNSAQVKKALKEIEELQAKEKLTKDGPPRGVQQPPDTSLPMKPPAVAFAGGAAFGIKTISSRSHDDASKANLLYGIGAGLAVVTGAMFLFDF